MFGLIFIAIAIIGRVIVDAINAGVIDMIIVRLNNHIVSRMEILEREDILNMLSFSILIKGEKNENRCMDYYGYRWPYSFLLFDMVISRLY